MIHPTAIVSKKSKVHDSSEIGPFCIIDDNVEIGENNRLISHVSILGNTKISNNYTFFPFSSVLFHKI